MITIPDGLKVFVCTKPMDMRKSFDGMAGLVSSQLNQNPLSGHIFVFFNKRGDKVKLLYWDRNGYCCWYKRLERGVFRLPRVRGNGFTLSMSDLSLLLEGIDLTERSRLRKIM
ncbi:MAG TPA: IS66 family insertion sequence element accessory protein TnpB [Agitococcus sp.]|nr:IS66 family insertion sequence element accessory protein TnpB [Agitococcus sp.]